MPGGNTGSPSLNFVALSGELWDRAAGWDRTIEIMKQYSRICPFLIFKTPFLPWKGAF
jgi:hypothetical protein